MKRCTVRRSCDPFWPGPKGFIFFIVSIADQNGIYRLALHYFRILIGAEMSTCYLSTSTRVADHVFGDSFSVY